MTETDAHIPHAHKAAAAIEAGNAVAAIAALKAAISANPSYYRGWLILAKLLYAEKQYPEAIEVTQAAEKFDPLGAAFGAVQQSMRMRNFKQATAQAAEMLVQEPGHPRAVFTMAHLAQLQGDHDARVAILDEGLSHSPANIALRQLLVPALEEKGDYARAVKEAEHLAHIHPEFMSFWGLAVISFRYGVYEGALAACEEAERLANGEPEKLGNVCLTQAQVLRVLGRTDESIAAFRRSLELMPLNAAAWSGLADMKTYAFSADDRQAMQRLVDADKLDPDLRCMAAFSLARALEHDKDWEGSFDWYCRANELYPNRRFDASKHLDAVDRIVRSIGPTAIEKRSAALPDGPRPIFILGMPRSGSTLLEQILSSHSAIEGTIEQLTLPGIKQRAHLMCAKNFGTDYLSAVNELTPEMLQELGQAYLDDGAIFRPEGKPFFIDKQPYNFEHVPLIKKVLPQAVIIDARRNPMDCGLSIFKQYFAQGSEYSYDLTHIGAYYNGYLRLMDRWEELFPDQIFRVQYEDMIDAPEKMIRNVLELIGLPFEPACLEFHLTDRAVRTASSEQVRQPINSSGVGVWRRYAATLTPLAESLGEQTLGRFGNLVTP